MQSEEEIRHTLNRIKYKDWCFIFKPLDNEGHYFLQVQFFDPEEQKFFKGRKWLISQHMVKTEIVRTAWKAVLAAEEHEAAEKFLWDGDRIYGPHIDVDALSFLCDHLEVR